MRILKYFIIMSIMTVLFMGCQKANTPEDNTEKFKALLVGSDSELQKVFQSEKVSVMTDSEISEYDEFDFILVNSKYMDKVKFEKLRTYIESGKDVYFYNLSSTKEIEEGFFKSKSYDTIKDSGNGTFEIARIYLDNNKKLKMVHISFKYDEKDPDSLFKNFLKQIKKYSNL